MTKHIYFLGNGNTVVFDENDEQIPELQSPWYEPFVKDLESQGIDISEFVFYLPDHLILTIDKENGKYKTRWKGFQ